VLFFILNVSVVFFGKNYKFNNIKLSLISMNKITYLFGAGASRNALPICEEIPDRINNLINVLNSTDLLLDDKSPFEGVGGSSEKSKRGYQLQLIDDLNWLLNESKKHSSVDTLAKN